MTSNIYAGIQIYTGLSVLWLNVFSVLLLYQFLFFLCLSALSSDMVTIYKETDLYMDILIIQNTLTALVCLLLLVDIFHLQTQGIYLTIQEIERGI